jgi:2-(1,2-epoxy-1,2-dihydrophenyl)acetyl-CoA isomerase
MSTSPAPELKTVRIEIDGEIGTLTLDRPDALNGLGTEIVHELASALAWFADRAPVRALIVTGAGRAFCAGGDVAWFREALADEEVDLPSVSRREVEVLHQLIVELRRIPYPVIAAVNGPAAGAGFSLALACDLRIASEASRFIPAYGRIGASPDGGMTYFLPRMVGTARALKILLDNAELSPREALEAGIVSEVVPAAELMARSRAKAEELAALAPHYARMAKLLVDGSIDHTLTEHLQIERHGVADSMATKDFHDGVNSFFAGEAPVFAGD